ncbi:MAG: hydantoinase/oxoprolinase family protein, partial [Petrotogales bacterium]
SGPSMCPKAGLSFAEMEFIENGQDLLVVDTGGTTFDVSMVRNGRIAQTHEMWLKEKYTGHILGIPSVDVKSIGAGGGSIAWLDDSGMVHVGPKSAGADPGPACYGLGETDPTVTDAAVVLGYINPDYFVGGKMKIYPELARKAISENIAQPLGLSEEKTAAGIMEVLNTDSIGAIEDISVKQGFNPRKSMIVTGGGAAPLHIIDVAKKLGIKEVLIPDLSSVLSATGSVFSNIVSEFAISYFAESNRVNYEKLDEVLSELQYRAENFLKKSGVKSDHRLIEYSVEARYPYQVWEIEVPLTKKEIRNEKDVKQIVNNFHKVHQNRFGVAEPEQYIEMITWKARAIGEIKKPKIKREEKSDNDISLALKNESRAYFNDYSDFVKVPRYDGGLLKYGHQIDGPAIIERPKTTVVVYPNSKIKVTPYGNYLAEIQTGD